MKKTWDDVGSMILAIGVKMGYPWIKKLIIKSSSLSIRMAIFWHQGLKVCTHRDRQGMTECRLRAKGYVALLGVREAWTTVFGMPSEFWHGKGTIPHVRWIVPFNFQMDIWISCAARPGRLSNWDSPTLQMATGQQRTATLLEMVYRCTSWAWNPIIMHII